MKKLLLAFVLFSAFTCTEYEDFSVRPVSFEVDGKTYYSAKDTELGSSGLGTYVDPVKMEIVQRDDTIDITYHRQTDFINYEIEYLSLNIKGAVGTFENNTKIHFSFDELPQMTWQWYQVPYVVFSPIKTSSASDTDSYCATEGWIEFTKINHGKETVAGRFEFKAVFADEEECDHSKEIEVKNGTFQNIPFTFTDRSNQ